MEEQTQYLVALLAKFLPNELPERLRPEYRRRLEIILRTNLGQSQAEICAALGCSQETARYWMTMAQTGEGKQWSTNSLGRPKRVNEHYLNRLKELVSHSPKDYGYSFERWTAGWLRKHLAQEFDIEVSDRHINRLLRQMGLSTRNAQSSQAEVKSKQSNLKITIDELNPHTLDRADELSELTWWLQNKI
jgi:transposase